MYGDRNLVDVYKRMRSKYRRLVRLLFPSPAELKLITIMGGRVLKFKRFQMHGFPLAIVYRQPTLFRAEHVKREVRCGRYYTDFANDVGWAIEVDGSVYHMDEVAEYEREIYMYGRGWRLLRIRAPRLWNDKAGVQRDVISFLTK